MQEQQFDGDATCWTVLGGAGSIEELRIPARNFSGLGIRLLDAKSQLWNDHWINGQAREIGGAGLTGVFVDGVGPFTAQDTDDGKPIVVRGVWDRIADVVPLASGGVARSRQDMGGELVDELDADVTMAGNLRLAAYTCASFPPSL